MERIASFTVDHDKLQPGLYLSRRDGDVVTFDLRFKKPNTVVYFGPMGCQTGFYFLFDSSRLSLEGAVALLQEVFAAAGNFRGEMPGKSAKECGNYINLDVEAGRAVCGFYAELIADWTAERLSYQ